MHLNSKGVAIIIVIIISAALMGIGFGISSIVVREIQISAPIDESVGAIMAADAAMERKLYEIRQTENADPLTRYDEVVLPNGAKFFACEAGQGSKCEIDISGTVFLRTRGEYENTQRAWQASY